MKVVAIVQARIGSTRLPGKIMKKINGITILEHVIQRISLSKHVDDIVIATTTKVADDVIELATGELGVKVFRGDENDVLSRYYFAAKKYSAEIIVRITSDCPLIDPFIIDKMIDIYKKNKFDIASNGGSDKENRSFPRGLDTEVFSFNALESAFLSASENYQKEHVTPYIYENSQKVFFYKNNIDFSKHRWTLDTEEDFVLIEEIYARLFWGCHDFFLNDIIELFNKEPELFNINAHIEQKKFN